MSASRTPRTKEEMVKDFRTGEILDAARRVIVQLGYEGASMERIAQEAGIAKGTTYLYFKNKEALLYAVLDQGIEPLLLRTRQLVEEARTSAGRVQAVVSAFFEYGEENFPFWRAMLTRPDLGPYGVSETSLLIRKQLEVYQQLVAGVIERGIREGEFHPVDAVRVGRYLTDLLRGIVFVLLRTPVEVPIEDEIESLVDFVLHGLARGET